jgi:single-strand DNA-binding protein
MASRSLNRVQLIGNLTRDPELRYTPQGTAVCTLGLATNRTWVTEAGERREQTEFHRLVAWNKLAELCSQFLFKGRRIYIEGRLQTRQWTAQDGSPRQTTEIVIGEMIILDSRRGEGREPEEEISEAPPEEFPPEEAGEEEPSPAPAKKEKKEKAGSKKSGGKTVKTKGKGKAEKKEENQEITEDEIPF